MSTQTGGGGIRAVERARLAPKSAAGPASRPAWRFRAATAATVAGAVGLVAAVGTAVARAYGTHAGSGPIDAPAFPRVDIRRGVGSCSEREGTTVAVLKTPREGNAPAAFLRRGSLKRVAVDPKGGTLGNFAGVLSRLTGKYGAVLQAAIDAPSGHDADGAKAGPVNLVIHPLLTLSYHHGAEIDARAFYAAVAALPATDSRRLTFDVCMLDEFDDEGLARYERAFVAARRVCEYRRPDPPLAALEGGSVDSVDSVDSVRHSRAPMRKECAAASMRSEGAVELCVLLLGESRPTHPSSRAGIVVAADGSCQARGVVKRGVDSPRNGRGVHFSVDASAVMREDHATQEATVVSAWLRGECDGDDREARMSELFFATIAYRWGVESSGSSATGRAQGVDYTTTTSAADFGDAWVVRDAKLRRAGTEATAHLVFVIWPSAALTSGANENDEKKNFFVDCVRVSVRAGLDAMIREGVGLALVTRVPCVEDEGAHAISDAAFVALVSELLQEKVAYVDDGSPAGRVARWAMGGSRAERGRYFDAVLIPLGGLSPPGDNTAPGFGRVGPPHRFV